MKDLRWLIRRLGAMDLPEIAWRVRQKLLRKTEYKTYYSLHLPVTKIPLEETLSELHICTEKLGIFWENEAHSLFSELDLFGVYDYAQYRNRWNAGFQTENTWPETDYSPSATISQRTDIGDIRTNWELNRHFQFAALAKSYWISGEAAYLRELEELFRDWNDRNLFLHGVQWTSAMEVAIRVNSWVYTLAFLKKAAEKHGSVSPELMEEMEHGILVMTAYIVRHRAGFSSANNHLIVEMYAVGLVGVLCGCKSWEELAVGTMTEELPRQNCSDGVNREMSLHYQCFVMEAYGLMMRLLEKNGRKIPEIWRSYLSAMSRFVADSCGESGEVAVFGDNDEGKLLDLTGSIPDYYRYVLQLMSVLLDMRYTDLSQSHENLRWLMSGEEIRFCGEKPQYISPAVSCYREGGYTFLRSRDRRIQMAVDHAPLGFGKLAAHGHADALSFQLFIDGKPVFVDAGTFNYHITPEDRDYFRSTAAHNTVTIDGMNQSQILGPFLWGQRAETGLTELEEKEDGVFLRMECRYNGKRHERTISFSESVITIEDRIREGFGRRTLLIAPDCRIVSLAQDCYAINCPDCSVRILTDGTSCLETGFYSDGYNRKKKTVLLCSTIEDRGVIRMVLERQNNCTH